MGGMGWVWGAFFLSRVWGIGWNGGMTKWFNELDRLLRGESTRAEVLKEKGVDFSGGGLIATVLVLGVLYGVCMGTYAVVSGRGGGGMQMGAAMVKVPALFLLTLVVTFPSLYVFNALVGSRLTLDRLAKLIVAAMAVMLALLASFGTIVAFFSFTTESYPFMVILNVVVFAVCGLLGLSFLLQTLHRLTMAEYLEQVAAARVEAERKAKEARAVLFPEGGAEEAEVAPRKMLPGALEAIGDVAVSRNVRTVFRIWIVLFGLVGAQMSWVLRPFIGGGDQFVMFRPKGSNFFAAVVDHLGRLLGIH